MPASPNQAPGNYGPAAARKWAAIANKLMQQSGQYASSTKLAQAYTRSVSGKKYDRRIVQERGVP